MLDIAPCLRPTDEDDLVGIVRDAMERRHPLAISGHGSKAGIGAPFREATPLQTTGLAGITLYEPEELVLSVRAGTPLAEIEALLAEAGQAFAFEPMDFGPIFGDPRGRGTIGGVLAGNVSGPRRLKAGAARDHVLGVRAVSGRGEVFKSGGRVVKNVTGYDLPKGLAGSWGTLAVLSEITFKVLPRPAAARTLVLSGLEDGPAVAALCGAMGSTGEVSGAAHLPAAVAARLSPGGEAVAQTLLRLEGFPASVEYRAARLAESLGVLGPLTLLEAEESITLWRAIRDVEPFAAGATPDRPLWCVSVRPTMGPLVVAELAEAGSFSHFYDWSGGRIWIEVSDDAPDALARPLRAAVATHGGGHATLIRAGATDHSVSRFEPQPAPMAALSARLKEAFDPLGLFNPGRMSAT